MGADAEPLLFKQIAVRFPHGIGPRSVVWGARVHNPENC
jgi:hypothetical protein